MDRKKARVIIDEELIAKIAQGDNEALTGLYELSYKPVFALLLSCTHNYHDAEDLLQETYIKICQGAYLYKPGGNPMAWIMKIAKNLYISRIRREKGIIRVDYEEAEMIPFENITTLEDRLLLETSFRVLNSDERNVVILHVMQDLKFREISSILDKPLGSVLSLYHRALKKLKKGLSEK